MSDTKGCKNCESPSGEDGVCDACRRDPETNNCEICDRHLEDINYPYVCGPCVTAIWQKEPKKLVLN